MADSTVPENQRQRARRESSLGLGRLISAEINHAVGLNSHHNRLSLSMKAILTLWIAQFPLRLQTESIIVSGPGESRPEAPIRARHLSNDLLPDITSFRGRACYGYKCPA